MLNYVTQGIWHHSICLLHGFQLKVCRLYLLSKRSRKCSLPKAVLGTVLQKTCYSWVNWKSASSEELLGNFDFRTEDVVTELFEDTAVSTKRISERGEKEKTERFISRTEALFLTLWKNQRPIINFIHWARSNLTIKSLKCPCDQKINSYFPLDLKYMLTQQ